MSENNNLKVYYEKFLEKSAEEDFKESYWGNEAVFTNTVIEKIRSIISEIRFNNAMENSKEYYRIDVIGWTQRNNELLNDAKNVNMNSHLWDLDIVVEHENNSQDWTDELIKLAYIRCKYKVIIGYYLKEKRDDDKLGDLAKVGFAVESLKKLKIAREMKESDEQWIIILGNANDSEKEEFDYRAYTINCREEFKIDNITFLKPLQKT